MQRHWQDLVMELAVLMTKIAVLVTKIAVFVHLFHLKID